MNSLVIEKLILKYNCDYELRLLYDGYSKIWWKFIFCNKYLDLVVIERKLKENITLCIKYICYMNINTIYYRFCDLNIFNKFVDFSNTKCDFVDILYDSNFKLFKKLLTNLI